MAPAFWSIVASIFLGILLLIVNKWWDPIAEYVGYPFDDRRRVKSLVDAVERLREIQGDLRRLDPYPSSERCKGWVQSVQDLCLKADKIKAGHDGCGVNYFNKCYFAREADKELKKATDLIGTGKELLKEAQATPHPVRDAMPQHPQDRLLRGMDSYKKKVRDFIIIQDDSTQSRLLGIWGMGGVGKTSLLKFVRDSPAQYAPFDHVLFVQAGRGCTVGKMQKAIAARMGLPVMPDETSQEGIIYNHLKDKSFLLLIDDLWKYHDLAAVGIPMPLGTVLALRPNGDVVQNYRRKVVFTTRSMDVCGKMGCGNNTIRLECLSEDDAWNLFVDKVGNEIICDTHLHKLAKMVVLECGGLPLALCTIGQAMSTKKNPSEWRYAIDLLKKSKLLEITNADEALFESLKVSFDNIVTNDLKNCFLICSLWSKGENIPKEKLIEWWVGLGFLDASHPADGGYSIINYLVNSSMLENGDINPDSTENSHVKMHKVICQMALWIVNDHGRQDIWLPHSIRRPAFPEEKWDKVERAWIFPVDTSRWSSSTHCPQLKMLVSREPFSLQFISNFRDITFLDLEMWANKGNNFPLEICALDKLQYLNLSASNIDGFPTELSQLANLKYLYTRGIGALGTIPNGLISQLKKLQGLDLFCSGASNHKVQYLASLLEEFASETIDLLYFGITVHTRSDIEQLGQLSSVCTQALCMHQFEDENHPNTIDLQLLSSLESTRELTITKSLVHKELVAEGHPDDEYGLLPYLEFIELRNLFKLQEVTWENAGLNIRVAVISSCAKLKSATWVGHLQSLQELTISDCPELEQVVVDKAKHMAVSFRQLRTLKLEQLPELFSISEQGFPFEELSYVRVDKCEKLKFINIQQRINQQKIRIDCNEHWWNSSVANQGAEIENPPDLLVPTFCLSSRDLDHFGYGPETAPWEIKGVHFGR